MSAAPTLPVFLIGLPGAGKSKVGRILAQLLGVPHIDTDSLIEADAGMPITQIFTDEGEASFRAREARAVEEAARRRAVVSLGGGAVISERVRDILADARVVYIDVDHDELVRRVSRKNHRPLLRDDPEGALARLRRERDPLYRRVASLIVSSDDGPARKVAERIADMIAPERQCITVSGQRPYEVLVGRGFDAASVLPAMRADATKALIVHALPLTDYARRLAEQLSAAGLEVRVESHPDAEAAKSLDVVARLWDAAGQMRLGRADAVIAIGGGATTDMAGFVAATWLRGVDLVNIPTTLLAMVDAAVGGKTGINSRAGKNLIGSFHPPVRVLCDLDLLATLDAKDLSAGLAEVVKCGFIEDGEILARVAGASRDELADPSCDVLFDIITRAIAVKARVVGEDLTESGLREILNYGHTFAHAIERHEDYTLRHGEAVAVGCVFASELARDRGLLGDDECALHRELFAKVGLPISYSSARLDDLVSIMLSDKKVRAGVLRFVLLDGLQHPIVVPVEPAELSGPANRIGVNGG